MLFPFYLSLLCFFHTALVKCSVPTKDEINAHYRILIDELQESFDQITDNPRQIEEILLEAFKVGNFCFAHATSLDSPFVFDLPIFDAILEKCNHHSVYTPETLQFLPFIQGRKRAKLFADIPSFNECQELLETFSSFDSSQWFSQVLSNEEYCDRMNAFVEFSSQNGMQSVQILEMMLEQRKNISADGFYSLFAGKICFPDALNIYDLLIPRVLEQVDKEISFIETARSAEPGKIGYDVAEWDIPLYTKKYAADQIYFNHQSINAFLPEFLSALFDLSISKEEGDGQNFFTFTEKGSQQFIGSISFHFRQVDVYPGIYLVNLKSRDYKSGIETFPYIQIYSNMNADATIISHQNVLKLVSFWSAAIKELVKDSDFAAVNQNESLDRQFLVHDIIENFFWDPIVLHSISPNSTLEELEKFVNNRHLFFGVAMMNEITIGKVDIFVHGTLYPGRFSLNEIFHYTRIPKLTSITAYPLSKSLPFKNMNGFYHLLLFSKILAYYIYKEGFVASTDFGIAFRNLFMKDPNMKILDALQVLFDGNFSYESAIHSYLEHSFSKTF